MGSEEITLPTPDTKKTLEEQLDEWCVFYMSVGVPYEEFWYGDYCKLKYYVDAYKMRKRVINEWLWVNGMYQYNAVGAVMSGFGKNPHAYTTEPFDLFEKTKQEEEAEAAQLRQRTIANLNRLKANWEKTHAEDSRVNN